MPFPAVATFPIVANNYKGKLTITGTSPGAPGEVVVGTLVVGFTGTLQFDGYAQEQIQDGTVVTSGIAYNINSLISFTRVINPQYHQRYIGQAFLAFPDKPTGDFGRTERWVMTGHFVELNLVKRGIGASDVWAAGMPYGWTAGPNTDDPLAPS